VHLFAVYPVWNANNTFGFERVPWQELNEAATITTVSRFMKQKMWDFGVDPRVIPNGIGTQWLEPCDRNVGSGSSGTCSICGDPDRVKQLRHHARRTATRFTWDQVIRAHFNPMLTSAGLGAA